MHLVSGCLYDSCDLDDNLQLGLGVPLPPISGQNLTEVRPLIVKGGEKVFQVFDLAAVERIVQDAPDGGGDEDERGKSLRLHDR